MHWHRPCPVSSPLSLSLSFFSFFSFFCSITFKLDTCVYLFLIHSLSHSFKYFIKANGDNNIMINKTGYFVVMIAESCSVRLCGRTTSTSTRWIKGQQVLWNQFHNKIRRKVIRKSIRLKRKVETNGWLTLCYLCTVSWCVRVLSQHCHNSTCAHRIDWT